jgi:hypothetical protein
VASADGYRICFLAAGTDRTLTVFSRPAARRSGQVVETAQVVDQVVRIGWRAACRRGGVAAVEPDREPGPAGAFPGPGDGLRGQADGGHAEASRSQMRGVAAGDRV